MLVECGELELVNRVGGGHRFGDGDVLWLDSPAIVGIGNPRGLETIVTAVSRARPGETGPRVI